MISVLLLDDDRGLSELGKAFLESCGDIKVDAAATVREAADAIDAASYDAIVSDLWLPDGDGLMLLRRVREKDQRVPFIMLTGSNRNDIAVEAYGLGANHYLKKSYDMESQFAEIRHLLRRAVKERRTDEELFMARLQARLAMAPSRVISWYFDIEKELFRFDAGFADFYGGGASGEDGPSMPKEEYVRRFVHPEDAGRLRQWICKGADHLGPGEYVQACHRFVRGDGQVRYLLTRVAYFGGGDGRKAMVYGINQDITDIWLSQGKAKKTPASPENEDEGPRIGFCELSGSSSGPHGFSGLGAEV